MVRTLITDTLGKTGERVMLSGWVNTRRDHGKIIFVDLRDRTGIVQTVGTDSLSGLRCEDVVEIIGTVAQRPDHLINTNIPTGEIEIQVEDVKVLSKAQDLPFDIYGDGLEIDESIRLKYRYLDLRRPRLQRNLRARHKVLSKI